MSNAVGQMIKEMPSLWFQSIVPNGCRLGTVCMDEGGCFVQFLIDGIDESFHYEILFVDEKFVEGDPSLKRYKEGMVYVELHAEPERDGRKVDKWRRKNESLLALLNDKLSRHGDAFVKEWSGDGDKASLETGFAYRLQEGVGYHSIDEGQLKQLIGERLGNLVRACNPIISKASCQAAYQQWRFFLSGGEIELTRSQDFSARICGQRSCAVEMLSGVRIADVLVGDKVEIPDYQRKYCWGRSQVEHLLESIWYFPWGKNDKLHLGTIVLHERTDLCGDVYYDIVDGQQRLITLSLLFKLAKVKIVSDPGREALPYALLKSRKANEDFKWHIYNNARCIVEWMAASSLKCEPVWLENIQVDVIIVNGNNRLGLVYTFFNAINSAGKKLTDYDLLKPHHLRYLAHGDPKGYFASGWDDFVQEKVPTFGGSEAYLSDELMDCNLYRLRSWSRNRLVSCERHHVFNHFAAYSSIVNAPSVDLRDFEVDAGLGGGRAFFHYVSEYRGRYCDFLNTTAVRELHGFCASWRHAVILNIIRAVLFQYFCKFGDAYLCDALVFITERIGKIRAMSPKISAKKILQNPIIAHTVEALDEAPSPEYFFAYCVLPTNKYVHDGIDDQHRTHIKPAFWRGVKDMFDSVKDGLAFRQNARVIEVEKIYSMLES